MDPIVVKYRWTEEELTQSIHWQMRHSMRPFFRLALWVIGILFILTGFAVFMDGSMVSGALIFLFGLLFFPMVGPWGKWIPRRRFRQSPDKNAEIEWRISPAEIQVIGPRSNMQAQ